VIYIIKFSEPIGNPTNRRGQAQFYLGWCEDDRLMDRFHDHCTGRGARITAAAVKQGRRLEIVLTLPGDRTEERRLKNYKNTARLVQRRTVKEIQK
jgi:hypothetical protein